MSATEPSEGGAGVIRDRGYQRWEGKLTARGSRFGLIAGRMLKMTARQPWVIVMLILPALPALVYAVIMYLKLAILHAAGSQLAAAGGGKQLFTSPDDYVFDAVCGVVPTLLAFLMALFAGGGAVADDARAGSFQFYFARPVTREQYLAGKLIPPIVLCAVVSMAPPLLLGILRVALAQTGDEAQSVALLPFKGLALGALNAVVLGTVAVALSSLARHRAYVQGGFACLYLLPWMVGLTFTRITRSAWPQLLSLRLHVLNIGHALFAIAPEEGERFLPVSVSLVVLLAVVVGGIVLLRRRLAAVEVIAG